MTSATTWRIRDPRCIILVQALSTKPSRSTCALETLACISPVFQLLLYFSAAPSLINGTAIHPGPRSETSLSLNYYIESMTATLLLSLSSVHHFLTLPHLAVWPVWQQKASLLLTSRLQLERSFLRLPASKHIIPSLFTWKSSLRYSILEKKLWSKLFLKDCRKKHREGKNKV